MAKCAHGLLCVLLLGSFFSNAEDAPGQVAENVASDRQSTLFRLAETYVSQYDVVYGEKYKQKLDQKWKDWSNGSDFDENRTANEILIARLTSIKDKCSDNKDVPAELVYEACYVMAKYEQTHMFMPDCLIKILKSDDDAYAKMIAFLKLKAIQTLAEAALTKGGEKKGD